MIAAGPTASGWGTGIGAADVDGDGYKDLLSGQPGYPTFRSAFVVTLRHELLEIDKHTISVSQGGTATMAIRADAAHAGDPYLVLGGISGYAPGFDFSGVHVPINWDPLTNAFLANINSVVLPGQFGYLDAGGDAICMFVLPPNITAAVGWHFDWTTVVLCSLPTFCFADASKARPVTLVQ